MSLSADNLIYKGPNLPCTGIEKYNDGTVGIQKIEQKLCELTTAIYNLQQEINNLNPVPTTSTTTTALTQGTVVIQNNSVNINIDNAYYAWAGNPFPFVPGNFPLVPFGNSGFPVLPGQTKTFIVPTGSGVTGLFVTFPPNPGGGQLTVSCPGSTIGPTPINSFGGTVIGTANCSIPISMGTSYSVVLNQI